MFRTLYFKSVSYFWDMQKSYLFILLVLFGVFSCTENNKPSAANHTIIGKPIPDLAAEALYQAGRTLFITNCASCHMVKNNLTGPALLGVEQRWQSKKLLYEFISNPQAVIAKNAYAKALYNDYNKTEMTAFPSLTDVQIDLILKYVKAEAMRE